MLLLHKSAARNRDENTYIVRIYIELIRLKFARRRFRREVQVLVSCLHQLVLDIHSIAAASTQKFNKHKSSYILATLPIDHML